MQISKLRPKYKTPLIVIVQTVSQLAIEYGPRFIATLLGAFHNNLVYGDVISEDATLFTKLMGTKTIYEAREDDQEFGMVTAEIEMLQTDKEKSKKSAPIYKTE